MYRKTARDWRHGIYTYRSMVGGLCKEVTLSVSGEMAVFLSSVAQAIIMPCCFRQ